MRNRKRDADAPARLPFRREIRLRWRGVREDVLVQPADRILATALGWAAGFDWWTQEELERTMTAPAERVL
jgi:hypothetical protein